MTTPSKPLSYEASKCVLQYLPIEHRLNIRDRCPGLRSAESVAPLKIDFLRIDPFSLRFDNIEYRFTCKKNTEDALRCGSNRIEIINNRRDSTESWNFGAYRSLDTRRSFVMHSILYGRRNPARVESLKLKRWFPSYSNGFIQLETKFQFPRDFKMKLKHLEVHQIDEVVMQQLSDHIVPDPFTTFKLAYIEDGEWPNLNYVLIQNAQKLEIPYDAMLRTFHSLPAINQKEFIMNHCGARRTLYNTHMINRVIQDRRESNLETRTNITIDTVENIKNRMLARLLQEPLARQAVVDDMENNQFNIPCVCVPMGPTTDLIVYGIPGIISDTILKIRVMPKGSARLNV